jgi:gluconokinase
MSHDYFIGVDIGTTSTKAIVFSAAGDVKGMGNYGYPLLVPQSGWAEQDPKAIFQATIAAIRQAVEHSQIMPSHIAAICFSGAMHSLIAVDANAEPLYPAIIWADNRGVAQATSLKQHSLGHSLYLKTGTPIHPMAHLPKLLWLQQNSPLLFNRSHRFISIKEFVNLAFFLPVTFLLVAFARPISLPRHFAPLLKTLYQTSNLTLDVTQVNLMTDGAD